LEKQKKPNPARTPTTNATNAAGTEVAPAAAIEVVNEEALIRPPAAIRRRRTAKYGDGHECIYDCLAANGVCTLCHEEHNYCNFMNSSSKCQTCFRLALKCPSEESKASYVIQKLLGLYTLRKEFVGRIPDSSHFSERDTRPLKAIIFSQFRNALDVVGDRLLRRFGTACVAEYWGRYRTQELSKFTNDSACFCMLLSKDGSEGLDLSFVTHIVFLEEIWDKSLEDQAVARAYRMGAHGAVEVDTLIAENSIEETMREMYASKRGAEAEKGNQKEQEVSKTHYLLKSLRLKTDYHGLSGTSTVHKGATSPNGKTRDVGPSSSAGKKRSSAQMELAATSSRPKKPKVRFQL
jgi:hypothetical protein